MDIQEPSRTKGFLCKNCGIVCSNMSSFLEHTEACHQSESDRKFKCDECGRGYRHAGSLANHKKTHEVGTFQCHICTRKLSNALALKSHLRIHTSRKKYSCMECGKAFRLATQLATHQKVHRNQELRGRTKSNDLTHNQAESICEDDQLQQVGEQDFSIVSDLSPDIGLDVAPENSFSNGLMSELIPSSAPESDAFANGDNEDRPYKCDMCEKTYRHHGSLINHKKSHQMGIFDCTVCFKQFNNLAALNSHQRIHYKIKGRPSTVTQVTPEAQYQNPKSEQVSNVLQNGATNVHFCHLCQVAFATDDEFQNHVMLHNSSSVSFELPTSIPEDHSFSYNNSITQSPEPNLYPSSSDTPPLPPLLDKADDYDQTQGPMENGHIFVPHPIGDNSSVVDTQGESLPLPSENLNPELSEQAIDDGKQDESVSSDRRFKCHICGKSYRHAGSLINHKRSHQTGIFQCSICRKNYPHLAALRSHLRIHKGRPSSITATAEGDWLSSEPLTHENQHGGFPSHEGDVDGILGLPQDLGDSVGMDSDGELDGTEFQEQFNSPFSEDRQMHLPQGEALMERHMCADCGNTFSDIAGIKSHVCPLLNQQYQSLSNGLDGHLDYKTENHQQPLGDPGECISFEGQNGSTTGTYFAGQNFHDTMHGQIVSDHENKGHCEDDGDEEEDDGEMYQCSVCGNHYTSMRALRSHLRGHTQTHGTPSTSGPSSMSSLEAEKDDEPSEIQQGDCSLIICSTCGESFLKKQDLLAHQLLHSNTLVGQQEQYVTENQNQVKPKEETDSIICGKCGVVSASVHQLESHNCTGQRTEELEQHDEKPDIGSVHGQEVGYFQESPSSGDRQYRCEQCGRSYRHAGSLLNHKKSHKTGVFRCFVCQKRFYNLLALKNHQRTHFDVKKHSCTECGKAFKIHKQLLNHQRVHQENKAKIEELNKQIQTLMQMSGNVSVSGVQPLGINRKRSSRRRKQKDTPVSDQSSPEKDGQSGDPSDPRPFVCDQCGRSYRHAGSLVNHKNSHKTGEYYCAVCNNTYSNQLAMKNHLRIHFSVKKHCCQDCGKAFRGKKQLLNHTCSHNRKNAAAVVRGKSRGRRRAKALTCKDCSLVFPTADQLASHICSNQPGSNSATEQSSNDSAPVVKEERPFKCNICGRSYRHAGSLLNHKNTHKTGHFTCSFCAKPFSNPMALRNHTRIHTQKKKYVCPTCGKAFRLSSILYNHQKVHARGVTHYSCQTCGKSFQGKSGLKRHRCYKSGTSTSALNQDGGDKCYTCDQCGRSYRHAGSLLNHKKTHSADLLHCTLCLKTFTDPLELQSHSQMARHCCPDCGKTFCEFAHLQSHMEVHSKGLPYYCSLCQQNFPNIASFQQHREVHRCVQGQSHHQQGMQMPQDLDWDSGLDQQMGLQDLPKMDPAFSQMQEGFSEQQVPQESSEEFAREEKSHVCEHCGRTYRHAGSLLNHKNSHKTGSFICSVCQKKFNNLMALKNHRRIHTEPKRYQCLECGKAFRVSTQLICHRRIHTKEKPFSCLLCEKRFSSKSNLRHHQKMHQNAQQSFESSFSMDPNAFMELGVDPFL
ncbi:zinc finger protein 646 [Colossoma macropomum]|uniref:zinc finger protein 646 n=1 Tax=Colossoma macropomum TaxID=42526 RepID=UPI0018654602|nr:zinc finger protein 646 [Colossoma macropomum]XP_036428656.1 zinc finger protein 646 [Colossoma macropomum]XP_036428657.1 zinc finger protein 646 [Colossoma macropomum]XP_036428658.1 zinc finger protein 646 [Colossoma macropomum]XP_036428659.1 zinc finger protein 646 [Colossoma macropomum]XP_036428660.1 zinc finger protein 646 [Colossoma macropomum]